MEPPPMKAKSVPIRCLMASTQKSPRAVSLSRTSLGLLSSAYMNVHSLEPVRLDP